MSDNSLDTRSPYIKNNIYGIEKVRKNILSFKDDGSARESSDSLLRQKINNISKKIVGEEIKKFADIASKEISTEFENVEKRVIDKVSVELNRRIDFVEQNVYDNLSLQNENLDILGVELEKEIDIKLKKLNSVIDEMETRIKDLEILSSTKPAKETEESKYSLNLNPEEKKVEEKIVVKEAPIIEIIKEVVDIKSEPKKEEKDFEEELKESTHDYKEKVNYINDKLKTVLNMFEKNGFLFKKNTFMSSFKDFNTEYFLNNKDEYTDLNSNDKEKMSTILIDLMDTLNINPKTEETIGQFLKRAYLKEYNLDKLKLNK